MAASAANLQQKLFSKLKCSSGPAVAGLPAEPPRRTTDPSARIVPGAATGRQSMTRRWQFYDFLNTRISYRGGPRPIHLAGCQDCRSWHHDELIAVQPCA